MNNKDNINITPCAIAALATGDVENFFVAITQGGIEAQESGGQLDFVKSQTLPIYCPKEDLESLGFVFEGTVDDLFVNVKFPEGWTIRPTDHSMWSELIDQRANARASIFYKPAFYDSHAQMNLNKAITLTRNYELDKALQFLVMHGKEVLFSTDIVHDIKEYSDEYWAEEIRLKTIATDWMNKNYPDNNNVMAYWD